MNDWDLYNITHSLTHSHR